MASTTVSDPLQIKKILMQKQQYTCILILQTPSRYKLKSYTEHISALHIAAKKVVAET